MLACCGNACEIPAAAIKSGIISVAASATLTYAGVAANQPGVAGRLIKTGLGTLTLTSGANTFTGGLEIQQGLVIADQAPASIGPASGPGVTFTGNSTLRLTNWGTTSAAGRVFAIQDGVTASFETTSTSTNNTINGVISGGGILRKANTGALRLGAGNTYSGGTILDAGLLRVINTSGSGTGTGPVTTVAGTTLGGSGTIAPAGSAAIQIGGLVNPGSTASGDTATGTLTMVPENGNVTFLSSSSLLFELRGTGAGEFDRLVFAPTGTSAMDFTAMSPGTIGVAFLGAFSPQLGDSFDLLDWSGLGVTGLSANLLSFSGAVLPELDWFWDTSAFTSSGVITVAPEPGRMVLSLFALLMMIFRRRRGLL